MKQIITCAAFIALSFSGITVHAQSANPVSANDKVLQIGELVGIVNDKVVVITKDNKMIELQGNVVTGNGKLIKPDGTVTYKGEVTKIQKGQMITADGGVFNAPSITVDAPSKK